MKLKRIIFGMTLVLSCSCANQSKQESIVEEEPAHNEQKDSILQQVKTGFPPPINIYNLNQIPMLDYTSGGGPADASYCPSDTTGFYGSYNLIDRRISQQKAQTVLFGKIIIYHSGPDMSNWTAEDEQQEFRFLELNSNAMNVWDSIAVGISEEQLNLFLEPHFHYKKGVFVFAELGQYRAQFKIEQGRVEAIKVMLNCTK